MAGFRKRGCRTRTWLLLKDSVIFVIIMCVLQIYFQSLFLIVNADLLNKDNKNVPLKDDIVAMNKSRDLADGVLQRESSFREILDNLTKDEFSVVNVNNIKIEEKILFNASFKKNLNKVHTNKKTSDLEKLKTSTRTTETETSAAVTATATPAAALTPKLLDNKNVQNVKQEEYANDLVAGKQVQLPQQQQKQQQTERLNIFKKSSKAKRKNATENFITAPATKNINTNTSAQHKESTQKSSSVSKEVVGGSKIGSIFGISENVMLPSEDPEREAQILYEKSLKEYHVNNLDSSSSSSSSSAFVDRPDTDVDSASPQQTLHAVCEKWSQKHCHCTGTLGRLSLNCRNIGILAVPVDLPSDTVIL